MEFCSKCGQLSAKECEGLFCLYAKEKDKALKYAAQIIGKNIQYTHSGNTVTGEVLEVHDFVGQIKVRSKTGKEYWVFIERVKSVIDTKV